ncbi:hypothetical protein XcodCFBP4690_02305 [Xanthomonas codiaei]|uniref:Uncharacterized protein n=1 Tax=Xanthomonas codiaei TaxID=56463 RepID=A0A2S7CXQ2_9XANT|nr:hypothetical protein XcodCFBP4690_02305 [Xanthomonas codiaei]
MAVRVASGHQPWTCSCDGADHWHDIVREDRRRQFAATRHTTSCTRTDRAAQIVKRVYGFLFSDLKI